MYSLRKAVKYNKGKVPYNFGGEMKQLTIDDLVLEAQEEQRYKRQHEIKNATAQYASQDITFFRHGGNEFSMEANKSIKNSKAELRERVYNFIKECGMYGATAEECERELNLGRSTVSARYTELKALDKIKLVDRRKTSSGRTAGVYSVI